MIKEQDLTDLVTKLKDAAGSNLLSVILYGSAATEEFHEGHSDLNILCVMQSLGRDDLGKLHAGVGLVGQERAPRTALLYPRRTSPFRRYFRH